MEIIGHGDEMLGKVVGKRYEGMREVGKTLRDLLDNCLVNERVGLERDVVSFLPLTPSSFTTFGPSLTTIDRKPFVPDTIYY